MAPLLIFGGFWNSWTVSTLIHDLFQHSNSNEEASICFASHVAGHYRVHGGHWCRTYGCFVAVVDDLPHFC